MKIITVYFERKKVFKKLIRVFRASLKRTMPKVNLVVIKPPMPENIDDNKFRRRKRDNALAFKTAAKYALKSKELIAITDIDLMFLKSITDVSNQDFDLAFTYRPKQIDAKYNTGLWFYRPTERSKIFVKQWIKNTDYLMKHFIKETSYIKSKGGIDQASLWMTLDKIKDIKILKLQCQEWNATQSEWEDVDKNTRVIHIKSQLRLAVFDKKNEIPNYMIPLIEKWKSYCTKKKTGGKK